MNRLHNVLSSYYSNEVLQYLLELAFAFSSQTTVQNFRKDKVDVFKWQNDPTWKMKSYRN